MPTGVEEAGLVMAAFPLIVGLIDEYREGLDLIKKWTRYKKTLRSLRRAISAERQIFENACYKLFEAVLGNDAEITKKLFSDRMGELWQDQNIEHKFKASLGKETWSVFEGILAEIQDLLGRLLSELQKNIPVSRSSPLHAQLAALSARFGFVFGNKDASMEELRRLIDRFQYMTDGVSIRRAEMLKIELPATFRGFRKQACDLCEAINKSFSCACAGQHVAILSLRNYSKSLLPDKESCLHSHEEETFDIAFRAGKEWKTTAVRRRSHHYSNTCAQINNLCIKLQAPRLQPFASSCLGFLTNNPEEEDKCYCLGLADSPKGREQVISLYQLLSSQRSHTRFPFYERDRLTLAITLSTSLLGLHSTPWLQDMWTSRDILFRPLGDDFDDEAVLQPYVSQTFPTEISSPPRKAPPMVRNAALYALGKVLIQLIENKPLVDETTATAAPSLEASHDPELKFASELEPTMYRKVGKTWAEVIRRCLYCEFDVETSSAVLDNDELFCKVYTMVICPLAEALQRMGKPL